MVISEKNRILINRVISTIDWNLIYKFYKLVGRTIGTETTQIPGIKKLNKGIKLSPEHIKEEITHLVNHLIENDVAQFIYGPWNVTWVNGEWEMEIPETDENGNEIQGGDSKFVPIIESVLEIYFSPMVVISNEMLTPDNAKEKTETIDLQKQLDKALVDENYELATKIRDLIEIYKKQK